ncbi:hypothetical protein SAMN05443574_12434 [Haloarcula vallismortis]|uniref:Uncharacterized protein n=3 Tax=Haloarcula vallismortis TaxID=28442 RepID=M0JLP2_HALVA|nr:hypothetical protein C437_04720 [Haloarcula vallismortis ATCC 29715]SDX28288.1 hypothetical protein SAMN05443574_12434 [Haloarcula vallismortis]
MQNTATTKVNENVRDMKITQDPSTGYPVIEKQGFWIVLKRSVKASDLPQLYDWLDSDDYEDLSKLPEMFRGVETVMEKPRKVAN